MRKDFCDKYLFRHIGAGKFFNYKTKHKVKRAQSRNDDDKRKKKPDQTVQSPGSIFEKLDDPPSEQQTEKRESIYVYTISGRMYLSRTSPGDLNMRGRCPRGILELFRYSRERGISQLYTYPRRLVSLSLSILDVSTKSWAARRAKSVARAILGPTLSSTLTRSPLRAALALCEITYTPLIGLISNKPRAFRRYRG